MSISQLRHVFLRLPLYPSKILESGLETEKGWEERAEETRAEFLKSYEYLLRDVFDFTTGYHTVQCNPVTHPGLINLRDFHFLMRLRHETTSLSFPLPYRYPASSSTTVKLSSLKLKTLTDPNKDLYLYTYMYFLSRGMKFFLPSFRQTLGFHHQLVSFFSSLTSASVSE